MSSCFSCNLTTPCWHFCARLTTSDGQTPAWAPEGPRKEPPSEEEEVALKLTFASSSTEPPRVNVSCARVHACVRVCVRVGGSRPETKNIKSLSLTHTHAHTHTHTHARARARTLQDTHTHIARSAAHNYIIALTTKTFKN